jgi:hypothetical protein
MAQAISGPEPLLVPVEGGMRLGNSFYMYSESKYVSSLTYAAK